jgi:flagellar basal-body rod protein FlgB
MFEQIREGTAFLRQALQGYSVRQQALSQNLSNADTPNYKRVEVAFEEQLRDKAGLTEPSPLMVTDDRHFPMPADPVGFHPVVSSDRGTTLRKDGNNVDIDQEMARLAQNEIGYNATTQFLSGRFSLLKYVISDGGGS